ncbi:MAG: hypothetical protein IV092_09415 [Burkholderiaceae bacterium]|nr:hypothetical protein [Burkholderiaceae bacterium]
MKIFRPFPPPFRRSLAILAVSAVLAPQAQATQLVPQNLTQLIAKSDLIVTGQVTAVKDGIGKGGVPYTEVTLKLSGSAKQALPANSSYSFRQYGLLKARKLDDGRYLLPAKIEGLPTWQVGEHVMSFMNRPAATTGLVTPVGLAQGKLTINGSKAANSFNNVGLFDNVQVSPGLLKSNESAMLGKRYGGVELAVLQGLVQRAVKNDWTTTGAMR